MWGRYPFEEFLLGRPGPPLSARARTLFEEHRAAILGHTDRLFALLMVVQFGLAVGLAAAWRHQPGGATSGGAAPLVLAAGLGGLLMLLTVGLALARPGRPLTRHAMAAAQLGFSALFIQLTAGHLQTHFHVFGSLALLAFYRDWKVFPTATAVALADQVIRPLLWPSSLTGPEHGLAASGLELVGWMLLVTAFLVSGCPRAVREMQEIARHRASLEETNRRIEEEVQLQTAALAAGEAQYRRLFEGHPVPMWLYDAETLAIVHVNDAAAAGYGYTREEFMALTMPDISAAECDLASPESRPDPGPGETVYTLHRKRDGMLIDVEVIEYQSIFRDRPVRLLAAQDVSRRLRAERLITVQQNVTRELAVAGSLAHAAGPLLNIVMRSLRLDIGVLWIVDETGAHLKPLEVSSAGPELASFVSALRSSQQIRGEGLAGLTWLEGRTLSVDSLDDPRLTPDLADVARRQGLKSLVSVPIVGGASVLGVLQFVGRAPRMDDLPLVRAMEAIGRSLGQFMDRKRMEERLHFLADAVEASSDAIYAVDLETRVLTWNQGARQVFGYSAQEMVGHPATRLVPAERRGELGEIFDLLDHLASGGTVKNREVTRQRKNGTPVEINLSAAPIRDTTGKVVGVSVVARDITEQKRMQARLHQAQKLESIGELAAGIAHEINTPTQYVGDNVQFLGRAFGELNDCLAGWEALLQGPGAATLDPGLRRRLAEIHDRADLEFTRAEVPAAIAAAQDGVSRISQIVGAMKEFSHPGTKEKAPTDLNRAIRSTITVARGEWKHHADVVTDLAADLPPVPCRADEFNQVILNLLVNAAHAIRDARSPRGPGKGTINVATRVVGSCVEIRIADTGTGIPEEIRPRIFDPFFTTKGVGKGTGQGLAIAHDVIVVKHGGSIDFDTQIGVGTTFVVTLPIDNVAPEMERAA